jgi:hypothetical protein
MWAAFCVSSGLAPNAGTTFTAEAAESNGEDTENGRIRRTTRSDAEVRRSVV